MSFSVAQRAHRHGVPRHQPQHALRPALQPAASRRFNRMLVDILRFNRRARAPRRRGRRRAGVTRPTSARQGGYSARFRDHFLVPLGASIWSADPETFLEFPAAAYCRFMDNHGLLELRGIPQLAHGLRAARQQYVRPSPPGSRSRCAPTPPSPRSCARSTPTGRSASRSRSSPRPTGPRPSTPSILAGHSDQSLELLGDPTPAEREVLGAIRYQPNVATLHTDARLLPRERRARASWNYHLGAGDRP